MTLEKFKEFIASFKKDPGCYTKDEYYEIGEAHKTLPKSEKSWAALVKVTGWPGTANSYRSFVNYYKKQTYKNQINAEQEIEDTNSAEETSSYDNELRNLYIEKTKIRDLHNSYRREMREEARLQVMMEEIQKVAQELTELKAIEYSGFLRKGKETEAILLFGDWHIGQYSDNFYNKYNIEIAAQRISNIVSSAIDYCKLHNVTKLNVINLGDLVEGIININARVVQEIDVCSQLMKASEFMAQALTELQKAAPVVTYRSCTDNHSRMLKDKEQHVATENLFRITDWYLEERLKNTNIIFPKDNLDVGLGKFELLNGMKVMFFHGHEGNKHSTLQEVLGATHEWIDIVCCGHWHNPSEHVFQDMRMFVNNSLCGTGPYALSKRYFTKPSQKLIIVENKNYINIDIAAE